MYMENPKESTDELLELINLARLLDTDPTCKISLLLYMPATELSYNIYHRVKKLGINLTKCIQNLSAEDYIIHF